MYMLLKACLDAKSKMIGSHFQAWFSRASGPQLLCLDSARGPQPVLDHGRILKIIFFKYVIYQVTQSGWPLTLYGSFLKHRISDQLICRIACKSPKIFRILLSNYLIYPRTQSGWPPRPHGHFPPMYWKYTFVAWQPNHAWYSQSLSVHIYNQSVLNWCQCLKHVLRHVLKACLTWSNMQRK